MNPDRSIRHQPIVALVLLVAMALAVPTSAGADEPDRKALWNRIAPFFAPPAEFANDLGDYRSVLQFDDGRPVKTAE
ncbi:MAG TPA: hypothetical protein VFT74_00575, partial [Isosphaeraceae bacterium]|nr:hypothetical protein [Isosphaeraceae bacterium]